MSNKRLILTSTLVVVVVVLVVAARLAFEFRNANTANGVDVSGLETNTYYVDFNYSGTQLGTTDQPFNSLKTLRQTKTLVGGDKVYLKDGIYNIDPANQDKLNLNLVNQSGSCDVFTSESQTVLITPDPATSGKVVLNPTGDFKTIDPGLRRFWIIQNSECITVAGNNRLVIDGTEAEFQSSTPLIGIFDSFQIKIKGVELKNSPGRGISVNYQTIPSASVLIEQNTIFNTDYQAVSVTASDVKVKQNTIYNAAMVNVNGTAFPAGGWPSCTATWLPSSQEYLTGVTFEGNHIYDCWGEAIGIYYVKSGLIKSNKIHETFSASIYLNDSENIVIDGNYVYRDPAKPSYDRNGKRAPAIGLANEGGISWSAGSPIGLSNITISNNLFVGNGRGVSAWYDSTNSSNTNSYRNISIYHNLIKDQQEYPFYAFDFSAATLPSNVKVTNNIIYKGLLGNYTIANSEAWSFANNNWVDGVPTDTTYTHLNSFSGNPGLIGIAPVAGSTPTEFKLASSSINIGKGAPVSVSSDYFGSARSVTAPSVGPSEVGTAPTSPADITAPSVKITAPRNYSSFPRGSVIRVTAFASDASGIRKVEFYRNRKLLCTDSISGYVCRINTAGLLPNYYNLKAKAFDNAGNYKIVKVIVRVY